MGKVFLHGQGGVNTNDATATADKIFKDQTAYVKGEKVIGTALGVASSAIASNIINGKTAYGSNGYLITGNMPSKTAQTYTPKTNNQIIPAGQYLSGAQTIEGSSNLIPSNIKNGVNVFGVTGTLSCPPIPISRTITAYSGISGTTKSAVIKPQGTGNLYDTITIGLASTFWHYIGVGGLNTRLESSLNY